MPRRKRFSRVSWILRQTSAKNTLEKSTSEKSTSEKDTSEKSTSAKNTSTKNTSTKRTRPRRTRQHKEYVSEEHVRDNLSDVAEKSAKKSGGRSGAKEKREPKNQGMLLWYSYGLAMSVLRRRHIGMCFRPKDPTKGKGRVVLGAGHPNPGKNGTGNSENIELLK